MKNRILVQFHYKKGAAVVQQRLLPERLPYMAKGSKIRSIEMRSAGRIIVNGEELEFQDVRILVKPPEEGA